MPSYIAPYRGVSTSLPAGYMEAATAPGRNIAAGITQAGEAIQAGLEKHREMAKAGKAAEVFYKMLPPEEQKMAPEAFANLAARDKVSHMQGLVAAQGYKKGQEDLLSRLAARNHQKKSEEFMAIQGRVMESGMEERKAELQRQREKEADTNRRWSGFDDEMQERVVRPLGEEVDLSNEDVLQGLARHGLLRDPNADNVLSALARSNRPTTSRTGTATPIEGLPGRQFLWMSENSGQAVPTEQGEADAPPPGFTTWQDPSGRTKLVRLPTDPRLSATQDRKAQMLANQKDRLAQLEALQGAGVKYFAEDPTGQPQRSGWWGGKSIEEEIKLTSQLIEGSERELGAADAWRNSQRAPAAGPVSATEFDEFQKWKAGKAAK